VYDSESSQTSREVRKVPTTEVGISFDHFVSARKQ